MLLLEFDLTGNWVETNTYIHFACSRQANGKIQCIFDISSEDNKRSVDFEANGLEVITLSDGHSNTTGTYNQNGTISWFRAGKLISSWYRPGMQ